MNIVQPPILINGKEYDWAEITVTLAGGAPLIGITAVDYEMKREIKNIYGQGAQPISQGYGNVTYTASINIKMSELVNLRSSAPNQDITQIPRFTVIVSFADTENAIVVNRLLNCKFTNDVVNAKQNDQSLDCKLDLNIAGIAYV